MNTAQKILTAHTTINSEGTVIYDHAAIYDKCEMHGTGEQQWEGETTRYMFPDESVLVSKCGDYSVLNRSEYTDLEIENMRDYITHHFFDGVARLLMMALDAVVAGTEREHEKDAVLGIYRSVHPENSI